MRKSVGQNEFDLVFSGRDRQYAFVGQRFVLDPLELSLA